MVSCKKATGSLSTIVSVVSPVASSQKEGAGCGRQVGGEGDRYSFGARACKVAPALSPKGGHDPTQERMALKTLFLYM